MFSYALSAFSRRVLGDALCCSMEQRLFNGITLINGILNLIGAFMVLKLPNGIVLCMLHVGAGIAFLLFYTLSRKYQLHCKLYGYLMVTIAAFIGINTLLNSGSLGGTHYYLLVSVAIGVILAETALRAFLSILLFCLLALGIFGIEFYSQDRVIYYTEGTEALKTVAHLPARLADVPGNFIFSMVLTGLLIHILAHTLRQERARSETLLLNILPSSIAEELKLYQQVEPRDFKSATILFTDFKGFTAYAEKNTPKDVVGDLDACFRAFDSIICSFGIEKIKTIGDAYMAAAGIPEPLTAHPVRMVLAALQMHQAVAAINSERLQTGKPAWQMRLGIHCGHLTAGVIGKHKFSYDIWGDSVNVASRMESSGESGKINISGDCFILIRDFFECTPRGPLPIKNRGEISMYFVNRIKPEFSNDAAGIHPNAKLLKYIKTVNV